MIFYKLRIDKVTDEEKQIHTVYGIDVFERIHIVPDIFTNKRRARQFVRQCNRLQLSPVHIEDAIENALAE